MFTGIIEAKGYILEIIPTDEGKYFEIQTPKKFDDVKIGDSISINGACMTVTKLEKNSFSIYTSFQSLKLTNLSILEIHNIINLERAMKMNDRLGGHVVQGHVDGMGKVVFTESRDKGKTLVYHIQCPTALMKYMIQRGSITIDGISLTIVSIREPDQIELVLIPETIEKTNASNWKIGSIVNIETDLFSKYIERLLEKKSE